MSQQWLFNDQEQAKKEFYRKEQEIKEGILVLIDQTVHYFENKKDWENQQVELLKNNPGQYFLTNLIHWNQWLRERGRLFLSLGD